MNKIIHFIKYNNTVVLIFLFVFLLSSGVFAQTETGQDLIGQKQTRVEGVDNTLLLEADLDNFDMDFNIEKIESDEKYYYVTYTYLDLLKQDNAWRYQMMEKTRKISKKIRKDLGDYLAEELGEQYEARIADLREAQEKNRSDGKETRVELTEYDGLIGQSLQVASRIFSNYEPVKKREIASPLAPQLLSLADVEAGVTVDEESKSSDDMSLVYEEYILEMDPDLDDVFGILDNCPEVYNPRQLDADEDGIGDECDNSFDQKSNTVDKGDSSEGLVEEDPELLLDMSSSTEVVLDNATSSPATTTESTSLKSDEKQEETPEPQAEYITTESQPDSEAEKLTSQEEMTVEEETVEVVEVINQ